MPISLTIQCSFILTTYKARTKPETWHHYLPPSTISKRTLSGVLGHIKYHLFPSNNIAFFCLCFYPSSQLMFSSRNCNILAVGQCAPLPRRTMHHKIRAVSNDRNAFSGIFLFYSKKLWRPISQLPDVVQRPFSTQNHRLEFLSAHKHLPGLGEA